MTGIRDAMMISNTKREKTALFLNMLIVFLEAYALFQAFFKADGGFNWHFLQYYCHIANICTLFSSLFVSLELMKELQTDDGTRTAYPARLFKFASATAMVFSLFITVFVLVPFDSFGKGRLYLLTGYYFLEHLLCPVLAFLTISVFGDYRDFGNKEAILAVIPTALYASAMFILNALRVMPAPFPFFSVYSQSWYVSVLWFFGLLGFSYGCAWLLIAVAGKIRIAETPAHAASKTGE